MKYSQGMRADTVEIKITKQSKKSVQSTDKKRMLMLSIQYNTQLLYILAGCVYSNFVTLHCITVSAFFSFFFFLSFFHYYCVTL